MDESEVIAPEYFGGVFRNRKVLLTGHTGFKGSWMAAWLSKLGAEVAGFARDPMPHEKLYDALGLSQSFAIDVRGELSDLETLTGVVRDFRPDFVFHLAAQPLVRLSYDIPVETFATNVMGTAHVLEAIRMSGRPTVAVMITTDKCYENKEWLSSYREDDPMGGYDPYSASKGCAELVISAYRRSFFEAEASEVPVRVASARAGNVIGGGDWAVDRIVPDCFRALRAGQPIRVRNRIATRPWQHVLEPLSGYLWLAAALHSPELVRRGGSRPFRNAFNFGPALTSNRTVAELVAEIIKHTGGEWIDQSDPNAPHEASKLNLAIDRAFHLLGWQPVWDFEQTIARTAEWYMREGNGESASLLCHEQIDLYQTAARKKGLAWT